MKYAVTITVDATVHVEVEADSPEEAKKKAMDVVETPGLCHCCARDVDLGDPLEAVEAYPA